jgi:centromere protein C
LFDDHVLSSARSTRSQKRKQPDPPSPVVSQPTSVPRSNKRSRPSLEKNDLQKIAERTLADKTIPDLDHTDADYTYITVDQTEMPDQTEFPDHTELAHQTELPDQSDMTDQTEAPDETGAEYTMVDQTVFDYTTVDQTVADMHHTQLYDHDDIAETTELPDETIVEKAAPLSTKKKRPFEVRNDAEDQVREAELSENDPGSSSPSHAAQDFIPMPDDDVRDESEHEQAQPSPARKQRGRAKAPPKSKGRKKQQTTSLEPRPRAVRDSVSVGPDGIKKPGPRSIVNLRAGTPAEDEGAKTTRSGRTSIKPLKYWCNETYIWNHGEVEGIVRAEPVVQPKPKRAAPSRKKVARLGAIKEDEEEDEDLLPEAWEQELGVINSSVRAWDPRTGTGSNEADVNDGMICSGPIARRLQYTDEKPNRHSIRLYRHQNTRCTRLVFPLCKGYDPSLFWIRHG